jgi:hypothetical protein
MAKKDEEVVRSQLGAVIRERIYSGRFALVDPPEAVARKSPRRGSQVRVFVSYSREDGPVVRKLCFRLIACGYDVWYDERALIPGQDWEQEIRRAVTIANVFIAVLSSNSINSQGFVQEEQELALAEAAKRPSDGIFIVPLRLDDAPIPRKLEKWHALSLRQNDWFDRLVLSINSHFQE